MKVTVYYVSTKSIDCNLDFVNSCVHLNGYPENDKKHNIKKKKIIVDIKWNNSIY